jgi:hypothetical protein
MVRAMKRRDVERKLGKQGCGVISEDGIHTKWGCPCGQHTAAIPRHRDISPGVIRDTINRLKCLPEGWL